MASYDIDSHWSTTLNLNNVTDRKYLLSLYESTTTANYGAPRNLTASVSGELFLFSAAVSRVMRAGTKTRD